MEGKINDISPKKSSSKRSSNIFDLSTTEFNIGSSTLNNSNGGNAGSFNLETSTSNGNTRSNYHEFTIIPSTLNNNNVQSNVVDSNKNNDPEIIYKDNKIKKRGLSESNSTALNDANASINGSSIDIRSFNKRRIEDSFKKDSSLKSDIIKGEEKEFTKTSHVSIKSENDYLGFRNNILNPYGNAKSKFNTDSNESNGDKTYFIETKEDGNVADYFKDFSNINNQSTSFQKEILVKEEQESKSISGGIYKNVAQKYFGSQLNSQGSIKAESDLQSLNSLESAGKNDVDLNKRADFDANKPLKGLDQIIRNYSGDIFDQSKFEGIKNSIEKDCSSVEIHGAQFLNKEELGLRAPSGFGEIKTLKIYKDEVKGDNRTNFNDITNVIINNDNQPMAQSFDFLKELTKNGSFEDQLAGLIRVPKEHRYEVFNYCNLSLIYL
ncbi:hypothetical protein K502DRAFT_69827 [Neoconidiobolus thromboides FSU 785]|nr:hypothetical protein K502DRAFT_69827 [Neoconidiobolus thromboides FSU 785]